MRHDSSSIKLACFLAFAALALAQGCSDDSDGNDKPDPTIPIDSGGSKSTAGSKNTGGTDNAPDQAGAPPVDQGGKGGKPSTGGTDSPGDAGSGNEAGTGVVEPPACTLPERGPDDCYNCPADDEPVQWLNRCVPGSKCVPFDNDTRVPLAATVEIDVSLPPLP